MADKSPLEKVQSLVQYGRKGSQNYSPLNVRALILSPDGALVFYHDRSFSDKIIDMCRYRPQDIEVTEKKYKSLLSTLRDPVCSAIEEVIIVQQSVTGVDTYMWCEAEINDFVRSNVKWQRLNGLYRFDGANFMQLASLIEQRLKSSYEFKKELSEGKKLIHDIFGIKNNISPVGEVKDDWYERWAENFAAQQYPPNVKLFKRFTDIKQSILGEKKKVEVEKFKENREILGKVEDSYESLDNALLNYGKYVSLCVKLANNQFSDKSKLMLINPRSVAERYSLPEIEGSKQKFGHLVMSGRNTPSNELLDKADKDKEVLSKLSFYCSSVSSVNILSGFSKLELDCVCDMLKADFPNIKKFVLLGKLEGYNNMNMGALNMLRSHSSGLFAATDGSHGMSYTSFLLFAYLTFEKSVESYNNKFITANYWKKYVEVLNK